MKEKIINAADAVLWSGLCIFTGLLIFKSNDARLGAKLGLGMCEGIIIPSLLGVLTVCNFLIKSRLSRIFEIAFGFVFEKLLHLPKQCAGAVILGLISGYPAGALLTHSLYERRIINSDTAKRIMSFNFCGGAAFIITAVGSVIYGDVKKGLIIYSSNVAASLTVAFISGLIKKSSFAPVKSRASYPDFCSALCDSVESTVRALAVLCAYIMLFSVITHIVRIPEQLLPVFEITNGVYNCSAMPTCLAAAYIAFGGLCVHMQLLPFLTDMKIKYLPFLSGRLICAAVSFIYCKLICAAFPESSAVFNNISDATDALSSGGASFSVLMVIGCAVIVFELENKKIKLHS